MAKRRYTPPKVGVSDKYIMKVVYKSHIIIDAEKAIDALGSWAVGRIRLRTQQGLDMKGKPFTPYSARYQKALARGGEMASPVDLRVSGTLINGIETIGRGKRLGYHYVTIGFPNKKIRTYRLRQGKIDFAAGSKNDRKIPTIGRLAAIHHMGLGKVPRRAFFGLSKGDKKRASQHAIKVGIIRQGTGTPRRLLRS